MTSRPKYICNYPGCRKIIDHVGYCEQHEAKYKLKRNNDHKQYDSKRGNSAQRGYDRRWRNFRSVYLKDHPLCVICLSNNKTKPATEIDHIVPHKGDYELFNDINNLQPLCKGCHSAKTRRGE